MLCASVLLLTVGSLLASSCTNLEDLKNEKFYVKVSATNDLSDNGDAEFLKYQLSNKKEQREEFKKIAFTARQIGETDFELASENEDGQDILKKWAGYGKPGNMFTYDKDRSLSVNGRKLTDKFFPSIQKKEDKDGVMKRAWNYDQNYFFPDQGTPVHFCFTPKHVIDRPFILNYTVSHFKKEEIRLAARLTWRSYGDTRVNFMEKVAAAVCSVKEEKEVSETAKQLYPQKRNDCEKEKAGKPKRKTSWIIYSASIENQNYIYVAFPGLDYANSHFARDVVDAFITNTVLLPVKVQKPKLECEVAAGFHREVERQLRSIKKQLSKALIKIVAENQNPVKIIITGHSQGGARAKILGLYLQNDDYFKDKFAVYTFGAPQVFKSCSNVRGKFKNFHHFVNGKDPIPVLTSLPHEGRISEIVKNFHDGKDLIKNVREAKDPEKKKEMREEAALGFLSIALNVVFSYIPNFSPPSSNYQELGNLLVFNEKKTEYRATDFNAFKGKAGKSNIGKNLDKLIQKGGKEFKKNLIKTLRTLKEDLHAHHISSYVHNLEGTHKVGKREHYVE